MSLILENVAISQLNALYDDTFVYNVRDAALQNDRFNSIIVSFIQEMDNIGYIFTKNAMLYLTQLSEEEAKNKCSIWLSIARKLLGDHVEHKPFYPNFPQQVIEADKLTLMLNAMMHYLSGGSWIPPYRKEEGVPLRGKNMSTVLTVVNITHLQEFYCKLLASKDSVPASLDSFIDYAIENGWTDFYKDEIPFKETLSRVAAAKVEKGESIRGFVKTTTDVLRVMAYLSGFKTLKEKVRFKSLKRKFRRLIVDALEPIVNVSDIKPYKGLWIRAFHSLHIGEFGGETAKIANLFRNQTNVETFETEVCEAIKAKNVVKAAEKLRAKPSVFARSLDKLVRDSRSPEDLESILNSFSKIIDRISCKLLIQLYGHFKGRSCKTKNNRVIQTAGNKSVTLLAPPLPQFSNIGEDSEIVRRITDMITAEIKNQLTSKNSINKASRVFIAPEVENILLPTQMASISSTKKTIARGSQIPLLLDELDKNKGIIRLFVHWIGKDIDLSALVINSDFTKYDVVAYTNLKLGDALVHSGDFTRAPAPNGASEFIDINTQKLVEMGFRYVVMDVRSFSKISFDKHEECFAGFMLRENLVSGEVFEARSVKMKFDIISKSVETSPCLFDMVDSTIIWMDSNLHALKGTNSLEGNIDGPIELAKYHVKLKDLRMTMKEFISLHAEANDAQIVNTESEADFIVGLGHGDLDIYDFAEINSRWI